MGRYLGNKDPNNMEVHDLHDERRGCRIAEIKQEHRMIFYPDTLDEAHRKGFDNCAWCIGNSTR